MTILAILLAITSAAFLAAAVFFRLAARAYRTALVDAVAHEEKLRAALTLAQDRYVVLRTMYNGLVAQIEGIQAACNPNPDP